MDLIKREGFEEFYKQFTPKTYKKRQILIRADDEPQGFFCLLKGYVRKYSLTPEGEELTHIIFKPISYFPMVWLINGTKNSYDYEAMTDIEVGRISRKRALSFIKDKPEVILNLMSELLEDYEESQIRMEYLVHSNAYRRVIAELLYLARHIGEKTRRKNVIIRQRFTHQNIADLVGVTRETTSKVLEKLEEKGLIKYIDHKMYFKNINKLRIELLKTPRQE